MIGEYHTNEYVFFIISIYTKCIYNIKFKGSFFDSAAVEETCEGNINAEWFYDADDERRRRRLSREKKAEARLKCKNSASGRYAGDTFELLKEKYKGRRRNKELVESWGQMTCEYNQLSLDTPCKRPRYFDDCSMFHIFIHAFKF